MDNVSISTKVIRSNKRHRTISAKVKQDTMFVYAPAAIPEQELKKVIDKFIRRFQKRRLKRSLDETCDLKTICKRLNRIYFNDRLHVESIEYSSNQERIFGSCNYKSAKIRLSHRLIRMPHWVRDYVVIHEMAHLIEPNHSKAFWDIVNRYRLAERARGYLIAQGFDLEEGETDIKQESE